MRGVLLALIFVLAFPALAQAWPGVSAESALVMDYTTGVILYEKNAYQPRAPASTTKILTALLALERGDLQARVKVSPKAAATPGSSMGLQAGQELTLYDLLIGLLLRSGNDAAVAIAEHISGSESRFVALMNQRAKELGAKQSNFMSPHGLSHPSHLSTAYDLAVITRHALQHPLFAKIVAQAELGLTSQPRVLRNTNQLLWQYQGADGVKTGMTNMAGRCLVASATRGEQKLVAVLLKASGRWGDAARLFDHAYANYQLRHLARPDEALTRLPVRGGAERGVWVVAPQGVAALTAKGDRAPSPQLQLQLPRTLRAPVSPDEPIGEAILGDGQGEWHRTPLYAAKAVTARTPVQAVAQGVLGLLQGLEINRVPF